MSRYRPTPEPWARVAIPLVRAIAGVASIPDYRGRANVPARGGVILAVNHVANLDPVLLARFVLELGRIPRFLAKSELFETPVLKDVLAGAGQIPVYRQRTNAADALSAAMEALRRGELVVIYPEGTLTTDPDGWPMLARNGVARLALATGVPVVPVAHWGAHRVLGPGLRVRPRRLFSILAGPPLDLSAHGVGVSPSGATLERVTSTVMSRIRDQLVELRGVPAPARVWDPARGSRSSAGYVRVDGAAA
ncbi:MAG TPA: lysophospholipid acyltransferase family protein [Frankiaceae bacterium]|nr:lysophospholipid acyltransferase family protein [Frankiaceae bacterium]